MTLGRYFSRGCQAVVLGAMGATVMYKRQYERIRTDNESIHDSFITFANDERRDVYDVAVIGGGIVGVATAREIQQRFPKKRIILMEREPDVAQHQSGHNSGCIHAGMFYTPGTTMARLCPRGHQLIIEYCKRNKLPYELCGKMVVATDDSQRHIVQELYDNGVKNGVAGLQILNTREEIQQKEPNVSGVAALWSPFSGITDFAEITRHMYAELLRRPTFSSQMQFDVQDFVGLELPPRSTSSKTTSTTTPPEEMVLIRGREKGHAGPEKTIVAKRIITCCGLGNDVVAARSGNMIESVGCRTTQTYGFRGQYYQMVPKMRDVVKMHIYPCPDTRKGLSVGVHFTPTVDVRRGRQIIIGPGSAMALHRYGYTAYDVDLEYVMQCAFSKGGWVSLMQNIPVLLQCYYMDLSKSAFMREAQKLIPSLTYADMEESFSGVMAVGVGLDGKLSSDLAMEYARPRKTLLTTSVNTATTPLTATTEGVVMASEGAQPLILHVRNAPSPAATACMAIAEDIVKSASEKFMWK